MKTDAKSCLWFSIRFWVLLTTAALTLSCAGVPSRGAERGGVLREADAPFREDLVPAGVGWFCYENDYGRVIARDASGRETLDAGDHMYSGDCSRARAQCVAARERMRSYWAEGGRRNGLRSVSECLPQRRAVCFSYFNAIEARTGWTCEPSTRTCESDVSAYRANPDFSQISACTYVE
jgi:hypothetical protein